MKKITTAPQIRALQVGAGLVAAGVTAAVGYYFYGSQRAARHRKIVARWATDMKNEVVREARRLQSASPEALATIVDHAASTIQKMHPLEKREIARAAKELKENWEQVHRETKRTVHNGVTRAKTTVQRALEK